MGGELVPSWDRGARLQAALTNILILIHKAIPILVDVLQSFLGSKGEEMQDSSALSINLTTVLLCLAFMA